MQNKPQQQGQMKPDNEMAEALVNFERPRITESDCEVLRVFVNNDELIYSLRNLFFGNESKKEREMVYSHLSGEEIQKVLKKFLLPEVSPDDPVGQSYDLFKTQDIANATEETFGLVWKSKTLLIDFLKDGMDKLRGDVTIEIDLEPKKDLAFMLARNNYIDFVSQQIRNIIMNANRKAETVEQMLERKRKNSAK